MNFEVNVKKIVKCWTSKMKMRKISSTIFIFPFALRCSVKRRVGLVVSSLIVFFSYFSLLFLIFFPSSRNEYSALALKRQLDFFYILFSSKHIAKVSRIRTDSLSLLHITIFFLSPLQQFFFSTFLPCPLKTPI